jgi:hypothetical protein
MPVHERPPPLGAGSFFVWNAVVSVDRHSNDNESDDPRHCDHGHHRSPPVPGRGRHTRYGDNRHGYSFFANPPDPPRPGVATRIARVRPQFHRGPASSLPGTGRSLPDSRRPPHRGATGKEPGWGGRRSQRVSLTAFVSFGPYRLQYPVAPLRVKPPAPYALGSHLQLQL